MDWTVAALYRFVALGDLPGLKAEIDAACLAAGACGTLLLAPEGINGTIAAQGEALGPVIDLLDRLCGVRQGEFKLSSAAERPFARLKVRLKREIVTLRAPEADPTRLAGTYVAPKDWNALLAQPDVFLLDTRNAYETMVGSFRGAVDPGIETFTAFKDYVDENLDPERHPKVAMFCTGGIRCEKASAFMRARGFETVYHLQGGILRYLEEVPEEDSLFEGDCYVFDGRVAVGHGLKETAWDRCFGCGAPLTPDDLEDPAYEKGVSCRHCHATLDPERAAAFRMRQSQIDAAGEKDRDEAT